MFKTIVLAAALLLANSSFAETVELKVNGLVCAFCAQGIEKTLRANTGTDAVFVSLEHGLVALTLKDKATITDDELKTALADSGYSVTDIQRSDRTLESIKQMTQQKSHD